MRAAPTLGLALISKNEEASLPRLLASVTGAFDRVALVDTGSSDRTVEVFETWARGEVEARRLGSYAVDHFEWCGDFSAARNHADSLLSDVDWLCWADCDDDIRGACELRRIAAAAPPDVAAYLAHYDYSRDEGGDLALCRERLLRREAAPPWSGRVHELREITSRSEVIPRELVEWVHHPVRADQRNAMRLRICRAWVEDSPEDLHAYCHLSREELANGDAAAAVEAFARFFELLPAPALEDDPALAEIRVWMLRYYAAALTITDRHDEALEVARQAFLLAPAQPDHPLTVACLTLSEVHAARGEWEAAASWATDVLERERPSSGFVQLDAEDYHERPWQILLSAMTNAAEAPAKT